MVVDMDFDYDATTAAMDKFSQSDINTLRDWTKGLDVTKYVPKDLSDKQLVIFYNACYGDMDKTKICIEKYYSFRKNAPEFFDSRDVSSNDMKPSTEALEFSVLPEKSVEGYDVVFHRLHNQDPAKYHFETGVKMLFMTVDSCLYKRGPQPGVIFLFDMRGVKLGHITKLSLSSLRKFFQYVQEGMPVRMRAIHVLNTEPVLDKLMILIRPFMDKKFFDMLKFHNKTENLDKFYETVIGRSSLPSDFGGSLPDTQTLHKKCMLHLQSMNPYFAAEEQQRLEALPNKKRDKDGVNSFKKLNID